MFQDEQGLNHLRSLCTAASCTLVSPPASRRVLTASRTATSPSETTQRVLAGGGNVSYGIFRRLAMSLAERLRSSVAYLDVDAPAQLLTPGAGQPSLVEAARELQHCAELLALLSLHRETPTWESDAGKELHARVVGAADGLAVLCSAQAQQCLATRDALRSGLRQAVGALATVAEVAKQHVAEGDAAAAQQVVRAAAAAGEAAESFAVAARVTQCAATSRALVTAGAAVKNAVQEAKGMAQETDSAPAGAADDEGDDSCGDFDEPATPQEAAVIAAALPLLNACLVVLQPVLRTLFACDPATASVPALDAVLTTYRRLASHVDEFTAALWPPQEPELLRQHCVAMEHEASGLPTALGPLCGASGEHASALHAHVEDVGRAVAACMAALDAPL